MLMRKRASLPEATTWNRFMAVIIARRPAGDIIWGDVERRPAAGNNCIKKKSRIFTCAWTYEWIAYLVRDSPQEMIC